MGRLLLVLALALGAATALAQVPPEARLRKEAGNYYLKERRYEQARDAYLAALKLAPDFAEAHYNLGVVYFFRLRDYPRALYHFSRYATLRPRAPDMDLVKELTLQALARIEAAEREDYARTLEEGTVEALERFIREHPESPYVEDARRKIGALRRYERALQGWNREAEGAYAAALARGTPEALDRFLARYPDAPQAAEARRLRDLWARQQQQEALAYREALAAGTIEALEGFLASYPRGPHAAEAQSRLDRLRAADKAFRIAEKSRSVPALEAFLQEYPGTPHEGEARELLRTLREEQQRKADAAWQAARKADTPQAYEGFAQAHPGHPMAPEARRRAEALRNKARAPEPAGSAGADWEAARKADTAEAYRSFLEAHPEGEEADAARARLRELEERIEKAAQGLPRSKREALERYRRLIQGE